MGKLLLFHSNSTKAKEIIEVLKGNIKTLINEYSIELDDINSIMPGSVTRDAKRIKLVQAEYIIVLVDIDLINDDDFYNFWQKFIIQLRTPFVAIAIQGFYGFSDLPIFVNQWPNIYGTELLSTTSDYSKLVEIIKQQFT